MPARQWPEDWAERVQGRDCPLCASLGQGDGEGWVAVGTTELVEINLERRSRLPGYCIVVWKLGHVAEPSDLRADAAAGYWFDVLRVGRAIQAVFAPIKLNYLTLGNTVPHLHTHVLPRYLDDPAPGGPIPWEAIFSDEPAPESQLRRQANALRQSMDESE
jgi:diadenosine tetraphosphate (Ap4A) HIT family hydrolase